MRPRLPFVCRFSDAGMTMLSTRCGGRRPKSAKAAEIFVRFRCPLSRVARTTLLQGWTSENAPLLTCRLRLSLWRVPTMLVRKGEVGRPARSH